MRPLSPLQTKILEVLSGYPSLEEGRSNISRWASPKEIFTALEMQPTEANRATLSRALRRLHERGLVARATGKVMTVGKGFRYVRIADPAPWPKGSWYG